MATRDINAKILDKDGKAFPHPTEKKKTLSASFKVAFPEVLDLKADQPETLDALVKAYGRTAVVSHAVAKMVIGFRDAGRQAAFKQMGHETEAARVDITAADTAVVQAAVDSHKPGIVKARGKTRVQKQQAIIVQSTPEENKQALQMLLLQLKTQAAANPAVLETPMVAALLKDPEVRKYFDSVSA